MYREHFGQSKRASLGTSSFSGRLVPEETRECAKVVLRRDEMRCESLGGSRNVRVWSLPSSGVPKDVRQQRYGGHPHAEKGGRFSLHRLPPCYPPSAEALA